MTASAVVTSAKRIYTHRGGLTTYSGRRALRYRAADPLLRNGFMVTGNTFHATTADRRLFGLPPHADVPTTPNGMDLSLLEPVAGPGAVRRTQEVREDTVIIGTAANLRSWKRIGWLIEATALIPDENWVIWVLGDDPDRERLERLARSSPAATRIHFVGQQQTMGDWLRALDAFVLPSGPLESCRECGRRGDGVWASGARRG